MKFMQDFYQVSNFMHHQYCGVFFVEDGLSGVLAGNRGLVLGLWIYTGSTTKANEVPRTPSVSARTWPCPVSRSSFSRIISTTEQTEELRTSAASSPETNSFLQSR